MSTTTTPRSDWVATRTDLSEMDLDDDDEDVEDALGLISTTNLIYERRHALRIESQQTHRRHGADLISAWPTSGRRP